MTAALGTATKRRYPIRRAKPGTPLVERLWLYIKVDAGSGCWLWTGHIGPAGYGRITVDRQLRYAHREVYLTHVGEIPADREIDHLCRNRACCNPDHLEAVTAQTNVRRGFSTGAMALRRDRCLYGHLYADHAVVREGRRKCRLCMVTHSRIYHSMTPEQRRARKDAGLGVVDLAAYFASQETAA